MAPGDAPEAQPASPPPSPDPTQAVGAGQPAPTPPVPGRGDTIPQSVGFVDPATYHIATPAPTTTMVKPPIDVQVSGGMVEYAKVSCEYPPRVLATDSYHIAFPYWELTVKMTPMNEYPWFVMEVRDKDDPNRIVTTIRYSRNDILGVTEGSKGKEETFLIREGYGDYYFVIRSESLRSFSVTVRVPEKYLV